MKKLLVIAIICLLIATASAQDTTTLKSKAIFTKKHLLYPLQRGIEEIGRFLQFSEENKAQYSLMLAERRMGETETLIDTGDTIAANETSAEYATEVNRAIRLGQTISDLAHQKAFTELIATATTHHLTVLENVRTRNTTMTYAPEIDTIQQRIEEQQADATKVKQYITETGQIDLIKIGEIQTKLFGFTVFSLQESCTGLGGTWHNEAYYFGCSGTDLTNICQTREITRATQLCVNTGATPYCGIEGAYCKYPTQPILPPPTTTIPTNGSNITPRR